MDKEDLEYRLHELENELSFHRATGRTKRIVNNTIEEFFQKPMGTPIEIYDHYTGFNKEHKRALLDRHGNDIWARRANLLLVQMIKDRLDHEYPGVEYELDVRTYYPFTITRKSETRSERLQREINEIKEKLNND